MILNEDVRSFSLSRRLTSDVSSAMISALLIAPIISIIDKAIFQNASGSITLIPAIKIGIADFIKNPLRFAKQPSCFLIFGVYCGTYITANSIQTICDYYNRPWQFPKFVGSSVANVMLSVSKDLYFTKHFGTGPIKPVSLISYSLYTTRDTMSILSSFILPPKVV
jgi:hypothetical protein